MGEYYKQSRREMLPFVPSENTRRVLDVGCGQGVFALMIKEKFNAEVWGIEMIEEQGKKAESVLDKVLLGGFDDVYDCLPTSYFDCIIFNDVLEHIANPGEILLKVKKILSPNGVIVCSIPNVRFFPNLYELLVKKDWHYRDSGVLDRTHLRFFTKLSISRMFREHGYKERVISGINPFKSKKLLIPYILVNTVLLGHIADTRYQQFACVMEPDIS